MVTSHIIAYGKINIKRIKEIKCFLFVLLTRIQPK